ncbi:hypothetical protein BaRGS_00039065 [Batillaria attramentaria]|uniref:Uncharacterized protein n=1 Tax=Batillaria attramentaria TaxID=370345 RepID=A0ABD0J4A8_9CAEN
MISRPSKPCCVLIEQTGARKASLWAPAVWQMPVINIVHRGWRKILFPPDNSRRPQGERITSSFQVWEPRTVRAGSEVLSRAVLISVSLACGTRVVFFYTSVVARFDAFVTLRQS